MAKLLTNDLILNNYDISEAIDAIEQGYKLVSQEKILPPQRAFQSTENGGDFLYGQVVNLETKNYIVRSSSFMPWNKEKGERSVKGHYMYSSFLTGELLAVVNGLDQIVLRTGAKSGLVAKYLAKEDAKVLGLIGFGRQAMTQAEAIKAVRDIDRIIAFSPNADKRDETKKYIKDKTGIEVEVKTMEEVIAESDILVVGTYSQTPLVTADQLKPGQLLISLAHMEEVSSEIPGKIKTYVDYWASARNEHGPVKIALEKGLSEDKITGDLSELVSGKIKGRESEDETIYFQSLGVMVEDLAFIEYIYNKVADKAEEVEI